MDLSGRIRIEQGLNNGESFRTIARRFKQGS
ncbi:helix-turn-helix domain-containing protein [Eubacterium ramulus]